MTNGRISLLVYDGEWTCEVAHYSPQVPAHRTDYHGDPVDALRAALIEDDRLRRDLARRYNESPKLGLDDDRAGVHPDFDEIDYASELG